MKRPNVKHDGSGMSAIEPGCRAVVVFPRHGWLIEPEIVGLSVTIVGPTPEDELSRFFAYCGRIPCDCAWWQVDNGQNMVECSLLRIDPDDEVKTERADVEDAMV